MRRFVHLAVVSACLVLVPSAAFAQASIVGAARDTSGAVLPGVTVEAASPALIEKVRSAVTDGTGQYRVENLRPGTYTVTFTLPGFATVRREGIELTGSFVATVNSEMRVGAVEETVTVTGETPVVDVQSTVRQRVMDREILDTIPSGRTQYTLGVLVPGVVLGGGQDVGGSGGQTAFPDLQIHGSKSSDMAETLGGMTVGVLSTGTHLSVRVNPAGTQEIVLDTAAGDAEFTVGGVRIHRILREGGNAFNATFFGSFANADMQSNNLTQDLRDRGLRTPDSINKSWDLNGGFGGPIKRDRLWYYFAARRFKSSMFAAGLFHDKNVGNPDAWTYEPDFSRPATNEREQKDGSIRLTWQASARNKIGVTWQEAVMCFCPQSARLTSTLEAEEERSYPKRRITQLEWSNPFTNRLLFEASAGVLFNISNNFPRPYLQPGTIGVVEQSTGQTYRAGGSYRSRPEQLETVRAVVSYITGAHAAKVGLTHRGGRERRNTFDLSPLSYQFNRGVPNQLTQRVLPIEIKTSVDHDMGVFAQDRWTVRGFTVTAGIRYDYFTNSSPEQHVGPAQLAPTRNITFPKQRMSTFHDVTPRVGVAYDLFGTGKTAVKVSLNKYLVALGVGGLPGTASSNATDNLVTSTTRSWNDANRNFVPDCDLVSPLANGECGPMDNRAFGGVRRGTNFDPEFLNGWGKRQYNWEFAVGFQHELAPRVAADVGYFRRAYGNFPATDNQTLGPEDFDSFSIAAPQDPRLPGGGGYVVSGLYDVNPARFGLPADNFVTHAKNYGDQLEYWHGIDISLNARPRPGLLLQGGTSTGRTVTDNCEVAAKVPEILFASRTWTPLQYCRQTGAFLTQAKFLGSYTIPRIDVLVSGTFQSLPGPHILANYVAPNAEVRPSLGRDLAGGARNLTVNVLEPGSLYGERVNQLDLRIAKIFRFGRTRTNVGIDIYNAFNGNAPLQLNNAFGRWQQPTEVLMARFVKLNVQFDF